MALKSIFLFVLTCICISEAQSQRFTLKIKSSEFRPGEKTSLVFETDADPDSIGAADLGSFTVVSGPNKSTSLSVINGKRTNNYTLSYTVLSMLPGEIKVTAPSIYKDGKEIPGETYVINISGKPLSGTEKDEMQRKSFRLSTVKPAGTLRFIVGQDYGYVESCVGSDWYFHRYLTKKEIKRIKKINTRLEIVQVNQDKKI
jgi:hypothetical protein